MDNLDLLKLLKDKKIADAYQFLESCSYTLYMAQISIKALKNVINGYQQEETDIIQQVYSDVESMGKGTFKAHNNMIDFLGVEIDSTIAMNKLTMEIMGLLHNFFDTFAQWINSCLLGEKALPIRQASLTNVIEEIKKFTEYKGKFINDFVKLNKQDIYRYLADFNNTLKHRYQIHIQNTFDIFNVQGEVKIPEFKKDGRDHNNVDTLKMVNNCFTFCQNILTDSKEFVIKYYTTFDCKYTEHRIYNPKTHLSFESKEDYLHFKNIKNHYHYIEVDPSKIAAEYQIMLVYDRMDSEEENRSLELYNSVYPIIMLKESGSDEIVGILKPVDKDTFSFNDAHNLRYRKYKSFLSEYERELSNEICQGTFHYYPFLSKSTVIILSDD